MSKRKRKEFIQKNILMWNKFHFSSFSFKEIKIMKSYTKIILCLIFMMSMSESVFALTLKKDKFWTDGWPVENHYKYVYNLVEPYYYDFGQGYVMVCDGFCCYTTKETTYIKNTHIKIN